jgi:LacI family transcriptional regulator
MYTMRDVARLAKVSVATVSFVANGKRGVSPELAARVRAAMEALDYHPDQVARSLRVRQTRTIGMLVPDVTNPFFTDVMRGAEKVAREKGYSVILCNSDEDPEQERRNLGTLYSRRVDGVLLGPVVPESGLDPLIRRRFPVVLFDRIPPGFRGPGVIMDSVHGAYEATRHLISLGHRRIAIIAGRLSVSTGIDRLEGFRKAMQEARLPVSEEYIKRGDFDLETAYRCSLELLALAEPPTAIFSSNNKMTLGLMRALGGLRISCPGRISVVGFDDFDWSEMFRPSLTSVRQPTYAIGTRAMDMLLGRIQQTPERSTNDEDALVVLKGELRIRESSGPPCGETARQGVGAETLT